MLQIKLSDTDYIAMPSASMTVFMLSSLIATIGLLAPETHAATLLFKSNFSPGVSLGTPRNFSTRGAWQMITGTDKETGYSWPITALGADFSGVQLIASEAITSSTIGDHITNEIRSVTGPDGKLINALSQNVKIKGSVGISAAQAPLLIRRPFNIGDVTDLYITYWFKYPADLASKLDNKVSNADWRTQFEFKTGGYENTSTGDYRIVTNIKKGIDGKLFWRTKADNVANSPFPKVDYWVEENRVVSVPVGKWFKYEVFWHRSGGSDGRFWAAVNGVVIVDHNGSNMGNYNLPINRIMINNPYTGGYAAVESYTTGLEIWDGFPCGVGVSCYTNPMK